VADTTFRRLTRGGSRPDLAGTHGIGRTRDWDPVSVERQLSEQIGYFINSVLRRAAPELKERFIRERLSNPAPTQLRGGPRKGWRWNPRPFSEGLRKITGKTQRSVRMTVTSPGTNATKFRGVFVLSSKVGGGEAHYAGIHEASGRMQFGRVTSEEYAKLIEEIKSGVAAIAARFGATVS